MKAKSFFFAVFAMFVISANAQSDYSIYLNKALEKLESNDCEAARKSYNLYKELSGKSVSSLEVLIADCSKDTLKTYAVGDKIFIKNDIYTVAHVEEGGKHGFAVCEIGSGPLKEEMISKRLIPTWSEFNLIKENNNKLKLEGQYWTPTYNGNSSYKAYGLGSKSHTSGSMSYNFDILYIYRF